MACVKHMYKFWNSQEALIITSCCWMMNKTHPVVNFKEHLEAEEFIVEEFIVAKQINIRMFYSF